MVLVLSLHFLSSVGGISFQLVNCMYDMEMEGKGGVVVVVVGG